MGLCRCSEGVWPPGGDDSWRSGLSKGIQMWRTLTTMWSQHGPKVAKIQHVGLMIKVTGLDYAPVPVESRTQILFHLAFGEQRHPKQMWKAAGTGPVPVHVHTKQNLYGGTTEGQESTPGKAETRKVGWVTRIWSREWLCGKAMCERMFILHQTAEQPHWKDAL